MVASLSPLRVAVADDDRSMRELLQQLLLNLGQEVVAVAENGQSLIKQCAITQPDVVITDNLMPDISGVDVAAIIHQNRPTQIILVSAYCDRDLVLDAERKHVLMYLVKPVSQDHLRAALARCQELRDSADDDAVEDDKDSNGASSRSSNCIIRSSDTPPPYRQVRPSH
jgi:DNA-binding NtrC family response regulator